MRAPDKKFVSGISLITFHFSEASPLVILNALGFIGFKVVAVAGTIQVFKL